MSDFSSESAWSNDAEMNETPSSPTPSMADIDREVADAMAAMAPSDLNELGGGVGASGSVEAGKELVGTVTGVTGDDVFLQFGVKTQGVLPRNQERKSRRLLHHIKTSGLHRRG